MIEDYTTDVAATDVELFNQQLVVIEEGALTAIEKSRALEVVDDVSLKRSVDMEKELKKGKKAIADHFKPFKDALNRKHKNATAKEKEHITPFTDEIDSNKAKRDAYIEERNAKLKAEQEERERKEAAERKRQLTNIQNQLDKDMEKAGDLNAQAEALMEKLDDPDCTELEAETYRNKLAAVQAQQDEIARSTAAKARKAEEVASAPPTAPATTPAKVEGLVQKTEYTVVVFDPKALCRAISEGKVSPDVIKWDMVALKSAAKNKVELPGCNVTSELKSHVRG
jgi:hypothetical protein